jgi:ATP-dependent Clp protease ATP-binding subunit ClpA
MDKSNDKEKSIKTKPTIMEKKITQLDNLIPYLKSRIIGQDEVINNISEKLKYWYLGLSSSNRPSSFFFMGPTGTGKTELVLEIVNFFFGSKEKILRLDMSELNSVTGSGVGKFFLGESMDNPGRLYSFLENNSSGAILYDEFEKAHPDIAKYMLQQLDAGRVTLWNNKTYNLSNFLIFFTSNIGSDIFTANKFLSMERKSQAALNRLKEHYNMPELVARMGSFNYGIFAFNQLTAQNLRDITNKFIADRIIYLKNLTSSKNKSFNSLPEIEIVSYTQDVVEHILLQTSSTLNGAREIRELSERLLNNVCSLALRQCPKAKKLQIKVFTDKSNNIDINVLATFSKEK